MHACMHACMYVCMYLFVCLFTYSLVSLGDEKNKHFDDMFSFGFMGIGFDDVCKPDLGVMSKLDGLQKWKTNRTIRQELTFECILPAAR